MTMWFGSIDVFSWMLSSANLMHLRSPMGLVALSGQGRTDTYLT